MVAKAAAVAQLRTADVQQTEAELQADIDHARRAMHLFLNSDMRAAEEMVQANSDRRLYRSLGTAIFAVFKAFMVRYRFLHFLRSLPLLPLLPFL